MNRSQFLNTVAERTGAHRRDVEHVWEHALAVIRDSIKKGEQVSITGFGKFSQRVKKARPAGMARNPFTGEMVKVAARPKSAAPRFAPAKQLKDYVAGTVKRLPEISTRPMALGQQTSTGGGTRKAAAAKKTTARKPAAKKTAKKAAPKKAAAKKPARRR